MKDESYSEELIWGNSGIWEEAEINNELNTNYLNSISSPYQEMVKDAIWNMGGTESSFATPLTVSTLYTAERSDNTLADSSSIWTGKIGLIYPSDYGYATSGGKMITRESCVTENDIEDWNEECIENNWIYQETNAQWTITPSVPNSTGMRITTVYTIDSGNLSSSVPNSNDGYLNTYPVLYLFSNVKISGGEGSKKNPYQLSL